VIRVIVADDHRLVRDALSLVLANQSDIEVVGEAVSSEDLLQLVERVDTDIVVIGTGLPRIGLVPVLQTISARMPRLKVIVIARRGSPEPAAQLIAAGASGYLTTDRSSADVIAAIRKVYEGGVWLTPATAQTLAAASEASQQAAPHQSLSARELQILRLIALGMSVKRISRELAIRPSTVSTYRSRMLRKLSLSTTADLIRYALEHQLN